MRKFKTKKYTSSKRITTIHFTNEQVEEHNNLFKPKKLVMIPCSSNFEFVMVRKEDVELDLIPVDEPMQFVMVANKQVCYDDFCEDD